MTLAEELTWRGQIKDKTFPELGWLNTPRTFYLGADCSADSLTIGNLAVYMLAKRLIKHGWRAVLLVGGATSLIGDPGGKDEERPLKSREEIQTNVAGIRAQVRSLFAGADFTLVDNYDWFKDIGYLEFLREAGKHFSMTELVQRDYIASRIGEDGGGISYAEFSYSLIQGYDYWHLYKSLDVELQIGGSDQWGNMLSGVPFIRKKENAEVHALSMPLVINKATGKKFGKSEEGAVWLDPRRTSPTQFYQFWINADDAGLEDYLKIYTEFGPEDISELLARHESDRSARIAQKALAQAVTTLVHGPALAEIAEVVTEYLTGRRSLTDADNTALETLRTEIRSAHVTESASILTTMVEVGLAGSLSEARRLLQGNALTINGQKIVRENFEMTDFANGRLLLKKGKKFRDAALIELV